MTSDLKPLARKPGFWIDTLLRGREIMEELGWKGIPVSCPKTRRECYGKDQQWFAERLWDMGYAWHTMSFRLKMGYRVSDADNEWKQWWQLKDIIVGSQGKAPIGSIILIHDIYLMKKRVFTGIGQMFSADRLYVTDRYYEDDGGPANFSARYGIIQLDGQLVHWQNASYSVLPTIREFNMLDKVYDRQPWKGGRK